MDGGWCSSLGFLTSNDGSLCQNGLVVGRDVDLFVVLQCFVRSARPVRAVFRCHYPRFGDTAKRTEAGYSLASVAMSFAQCFVALVISEAPLSSSHIPTSQAIAVVIVLSIK